MNPQQFTALSPEIAGAVTRDYDRTKDKITNAS